MKKRALLIATMLGLLQACTDTAIVKIPNKTTVPQGYALDLLIDDKSIFKSKASFRIASFGGLKVKNCFANGKTQIDEATSRLLVILDELECTTDDKVSTARFSGFIVSANDSGLGLSVDCNASNCRSSDTKAYGIFTDEITISDFAVLVSDSEKGNTLSFGADEKQ